MRKADLIVALVLIGAGLIVLIDSIRLGFQWGMSGPEAGFLPFYLGVGVILFSLNVFFRGVKKLRKEGKGAPLVPKGGLKPILWVLCPSVGMVLLTELIGLHLAALIFLVFYMRVVGKIRWATVVLVSVLIPMCLYIAFDKLFLIPLPEGLWGKTLIPF